MSDSKIDKHPAMDSLRRIGPDGRIAAYTIEEQWERIEQWRDFLTMERTEEYPFLDGLEARWKTIDDGAVERGIKLKSVSSSPLSAFFYFIEMGMYPPPELLFALGDCWQIYNVNNGLMTLEESFLGPTKKGAGNYAKRDNAKFRNMVMTWNFSRFLNDGMTRSQAAEAISLANNGKPDADSILRMMRGITGKIVKKAEK